MGPEQQKRGGEFFLVLAAGLVVNSAYVAAFGDADLFYVANALLHPFLGIAVAILFIVFVVRNPGFPGGTAGKIAIALLALSAAFGGYLALYGMTRPNSWALYAHVALAIVGLGFLLAAWRSRITAGNRKLETGNLEAGDPANFQFPVSSAVPGDGAPV